LIVIGIIITAGFNAAYRVNLSEYKDHYFSGKIQKQIIEI